MSLKCYMTTDELAAHLGFSRQEIVRKIWRGQIKAEKMGKIYLIDKKDILNLKKKGQK